MLKWNYESPTKKSTGYEDVKDLLKSYTSEEYKKASDKRKEEMVEEVLAIYRSKNIFPIIYFNEEGAKEEVVKAINKEVYIKDNVLDRNFLQGQALCRFLFPNMALAKSVRESRPCIYERFFIDRDLRDAIKFAFTYKDNCSPSQIKGSLEMTVQSPSNFLTMKAKALYEKYTPKNGVIYDFACGFGGRMLGALSSKNDYTYIGVEPCEETYTNLLKLGELVESVTKRNNSYKIHKIGSEDFKGEANSIDFAFSSPPYFSLEQYSNEPTQCYIKFPILEEWLEGYVRETIKNIYYMLKPGAYYAVNIADFKLHNKIVKYVDEWLRISEEEGFEYVEEIYLKVQDRCSIDRKNANKKEGIFIFKKP